MKNKILKISFAIKVIALFITFVIVGCKDASKISVSTNFDKLDDNPLHIGDKLPLEFSSMDATIDSYIIKVNDRVYDNKDNIILDTANVKLGYNNLVLTLKYNSKYQKEIEGSFIVYPKEKEKTLKYKFIQEYPHNPELFTQGFAYKNGIITESSGQYEKSKLVRYPLGSVSYIQTVNMDPRIFAEGFAYLDDKLYLLSWKEGVAFVYNESDLSFIKEISYPVGILQGWGATTIGNEMVMSDSSAELSFLDENFVIRRKFTVIGHERMYYAVNEMEYANGYIYANVFGEPIILVIDPKTGIVVAKADFTDLVRENQNHEEAVLNGIAHIEGNTFLITGKLWSKIYKVELTIE